jgi:hypothetical protein
MAESDIYNLLALSQRGTDHFLKNDPFYGSAINIAKMPIPEAENNTQAFLGPMLQGLLSGGLANYGKQNAYDKGYEEARANPLLRSLQGYESETRPQGWEPDKGQNDALMQALLGQQAQEMAVQKMKDQADLAKALATQGVAMTPQGTMTAVPGYAEAKAGIEQAVKTAGLNAEMGATGGIPGVPANKQAQAIEEVGIIQKLEKAQKAMDRIYGDVKEAKEAIPFGAIGRTAERLDPAQTDHERKLAAVHTTLVAMAQGILGAEPNARMQERIAELTPSRLDSPKAVEEKAKLAKNFLADLTKPTPTLSTYGVQTEKPKETVQAPDGNEYVFVD